MRPAISPPSSVRRRRARTSESAVRRYSTCGLSSLRMKRTRSAGGLRRRRDLGIGEQRLAPGEGAHREDFDDEHLRHRREQRLERLVDLREGARALRVAAAAPHQPHQHVARDVRLLEREIARGLPHLLVSALVAVARFVARVRFEERAAQVGERGARDRLADEGAEIGHLDVADDRAEALDDRDDRERAHDRLAHALAQQQLRLRDVRELGRHQLARNLEQCRPVPLQPRLPGADRRRAVSGARRSVDAVGVEAAVAAHAACDERRITGVALEQLLIRVDESLAQWTPRVATRVAGSMPMLRSTCSHMREGSMSKTISRETGASSQAPSASSDSSCPGPQPA